MIVLSESFGNNSNIFFQNLHLDAFCRKYNIGFHNPFLRKYEPIFPHLRSLVRPECNRYSDVRLKIKSFFAHDFDAYSDNDLRKRWVLDRKDRIGWVKGWGFRAYEEACEFREYYRDLFTPVNCKKIEEEVRRLRQNGKILSVHIRRGDYRVWQGGKYYFSDDVYVSMINKALEQVSDLSTIQIFSNEQLDFSKYVDFSGSVVIQTGEWYEDQWRMANSDLIIGPPSSFSLWASFVGKVPLWHFESRDSAFNSKISDG